MDEAWRSTDAVVTRIIPDVCSMVSRADPLSPTVMEVFADYVLVRG